MMVRNSPGTLTTGEAGVGEEVGVCADEDAGVAAEGVLQLQENLKLMFRMMSWWRAGQIGRATRLGLS